MAHFEVESVEILESDGETRRYDVIVDRSTFRVLGCGPIGRIKIGDGFVRCFGQHYLARLPGGAAVYGGSSDDTYYAPMSFFDGEWHHDTSKDSRGLAKAVTKSSGTGKLFAELEAFCEANQLAAAY